MENTRNIPELISRMIHDGLCVCFFTYTVPSNYDYVNHDDYLCLRTIFL